MVWRLVRWQPDYPAIRQLVKGLVRSKRAKKRLAVMAARHLAIDLWRLAPNVAQSQRKNLTARFKRKHNLPNQPKSACSRRWHANG
jgi:hypothetical protein